jgi:hypothetical protein
MKEASQLTIASPIRVKRTLESLRRWPMPNSQAPKAVTTAAAISRARPTAPPCWLSTHSSQPAAAYIGKARPRRSTFIHGPGGGRRLNRPGAKERMT